jgi:pimeloyl-ACP methyl ester carboxylesterase
MVCLHGFTDTWRTWELVLPALERRHDVLAPTLVGHAGGPALEGPVTAATLPDAVERAMDAAGFATAHLVGNSLGGFVALQLAARGRAESVVALAPAGGWARGDHSFRATLAHFPAMQAQVRDAIAHVQALVATPRGRRLATRFITTNSEHLPPELLVHQALGVVGCRGPRPRRASATTGCRTPTGSSSTASATARSSTSRPRPRTSSRASPPPNWAAARPARRTRRSVALSR